ncbi:MAG: hypothetical protein GKR89_03210 [Candidatus Latescibacteria bacterium]|nr:hypothetical protein [Candidatus Latescibacterota bacterium]
MSTAPEDVSFRFLRPFNKVPGGSLASSRSSLRRQVGAYFREDTLQDKFVRSLAQEEAVPIKEVAESGEFFARVRRHLRAPCVADLCCGHGLVGLLFALFERRVERVVLIDRSRPPLFDKVLAAAIRVGPWVADKVEYHQVSIEKATEFLPPGASVVATHACGLLTDRCLDCALTVAGAVAVMPCCYPDRACPGPPALRQRLGGPMAFDIHRTYRLEAAGYYVRWSAIPAAITPMHRILIGTRKD